jgi:hypothetical protein
MDSLAVIACRDEYIHTLPKGCVFNIADYLQMQEVLTLSSVSKVMRAMLPHALTLESAIERRKLNEINFFLRPYKITEYDRGSALMTAARVDCYLSIASILRSGLGAHSSASQKIAAVNFTSAAINIAAFNGNMASLKVLIESGLYHNNSIEIAYHLGAAHGQLPIVLYLSSFKEITVDHVALALTNTVAQGQLELTNFLLSCPALTDAIRGKVLCSAALNGQKEMVELILNQIKDPVAFDESAIRYLLDDVRLSEVSRIITEFFSAKRVENDYKTGHSTLK